MSKQLQNKPLVEAIMELRWALTSGPSGQESDPHYKLLLGRLFDRLHGDYPEYEQLPTASVPDELVGHIVQHRFRIGQEAWPLVQVGPGILTVNSTADYTWTDFRLRATTAVNRLFEAHPKVKELKVENLVLRYIDAVPFDHLNENTFEFLRDYLKVELSLPKTLFAETGVKNRPELFALQSAFICGEPKGTISIRFATGQKEDKPAILWETTVQSSSADIPHMPSAFEGWLEAAHKVTDGWFFKLIEGELERRFSGE